MPSLALLTEQALSGERAATRALLTELGRLLESGGQEATRAGQMLAHALATGRRGGACLGRWQYGGQAATAWSMDGVGGTLLRSPGSTGLAARIDTRELESPPSAIGAAVADSIQCALVHGGLDFVVPYGSLAAIYLGVDGRATIDQEPGALGLVGKDSERTAP